jgi:alkylation response protein AidB-like acyl-CoA dehydrogenase
MDAQEEALLRTTIAELTASGDGVQLMDALDQFGWRELLATDPGLAIPAVFEGQGIAGTWSPALHDVIGSGLGLESDTVVLIPLPGQTHTAVRGSALEVKGLVLGQRPTATNALAYVDEPDRLPTLVETPMSELTIESINGLDPAISASLVTGSVHGKANVEEFGEGPRWEYALADGRWALSHQLIGVMDTMKMLALTHALERSQFGRQIGSFQAIRHRLAETQVAIEAARAAAGGAGPMRGRSAQELPDAQMACMLAKLIAGRSAAKAAAHCQQVLAGVGFTSDHPFHRFMKRATVLERILGDTGYLTESIGRQLVARREAPRVVNL